MKKERAIELLKNFNLYDEPNCMGYWDCDECVEALYMAIEALEQEQSEIIRCKNCRHDNNCEIQYSAQAGSKFFCGFAEKRGSDRE